MADEQVLYKMRKTNHIKLIAIFVSLIVISFVACRNPNDSSFKGNKESFRDKPVQFSKHARCMMGCKHFSESEIKQLVSSGKLNSKESFPNDKPCPTYAIEGLTADSQNVRVIVGECAGATRVITVIDLGKDYQCNCN